MSNKTKIKICGITNLEDAKQIANLGVDYLGFIIDYQPSPRSLNLDEVAMITTQIKKDFSHIKLVGVFVDKGLDFVREAIISCHLDVVQLHGRESIEYCKDLKNNAEIFKAVIIKNKQDVLKAEKYRGVVDEILFDAGRGSGEEIAFDLLENIEVNILAGGLGFDNVERAVEKINPKVVDLNSCLEMYPGKKDLEIVSQVVSLIKSNNMKKLFFSTKYDADENGYFGKYGGRYVPELLRPALQELEKVYEDAKQDPSFECELMDLYKNYSGRPTPLYFAKNLTEKLDGAKIYIKNEGLNHTGAHKINHCLGQVLLAKRMGKKRLIAETGAGQHGLAVATVAAKFGLECTIYMGAIDVDRQRPNVFFMEQLGAKVVPVEYGTQRLKDAVMAALQDWISDSKDSYYLLGSALGPHPYPSMVRDFQNIVGLEVREQLEVQEGKTPDYLVACVGGGSNAIGLFNTFLDNENVKMIGVEAGGKGVEHIGGHASRLQGEGKIGVVEGYKSFFLQDEDGQIQGTHSISAGLDYAGIGPEHASLFEKGRVQYESVNDEEVLNAFQLLAKTEGILAALESSHAVAHAIKLAPTLDKEKIIVVNLSGRGDKDLFIVAEEFGGSGWKDYLKSKVK
ncbi:tryptophan synthase subunit beta [bacterium]|jgi:tryptophan synthase beta chain|nr:tryptophan synthase subunit beta [Candidatus Parcubacteria bacterium]MBT3948916.1 tryptophan synthase subunit beta [Candidatus Parcubacteria bacterium]MBT7088576.1 tryptophan synthase subunit beta [bacterium]